MSNKKVNFDYEKLFQGTGLKVTTQRLKILKFLRSISRPATIEEIQTKTNIIPSTLYRSLDKLVQVNLVNKSYFNNSSAYYEFQIKHHHHLTCLECGHITETDCPIKFDVLPSTIESSGFSNIKYHSLEFYGTCKTCTI